MIKEKLIVSFDSERNKVWAGYKIEQQSYPPRQEGFFSAYQIEIEHGCVTGRMEFPEQAIFEFSGGMEKFKKSLKSAGGARAALSMPGFTWWINS